MKEVVIIASTDRGSKSVRSNENHLVVEKTAAILEIDYTWQDPDVDVDRGSFWHLFSCTVETMVATNFSTNLSVGRHQLPSTCNLLSCTTQTLPSYLHHVYIYEHFQMLAYWSVVWMINTLTETIYDDEILTLLICLLSWASRTRLGWNRRANAENGILVTSFTIRDEQVLTNCCKCWKWYHVVEDFEDLDEEDIFIEETSFAIINLLYIRSEWSKYSNAIPLSISPG